MSTLTISDNSYSRILTCLGYPIISESDLGVSTDNIKDLLILPVLKNIYFNFFPKKAIQTFPVSSSFSLDFPDDYTFGIVDARVNIKPYAGGAVKVANPLINEINIRPATDFSQRMFGTNYDYDYSQVRIYDQLRMDARIEQIKSTRIVVNHEDRSIDGYCNVYGRLTIVWAKWSNDWSDIIFTQEENAIKLAQSYIMKYFGRLWSMDNTKLPQTLDAGEILSEADDLREEVIGKWNRFSKPVVIRN